MIIDAHAHLGVDRVFEEARDEKQLMDAMDKNGVDAVLLQSMFGYITMEDIRAGHDRIAGLAKAQPGRVFGMITMTPYLKTGEFKAEARRCVEELGFVGLKLHPMAMAVSPLSRVGEMMWETCADLEIPIMVHTGAGAPMAVPSLCIQRAKQFPEVPCVLAHCGMVVYFAETVVAAAQCDNIYMETSWTAPHHIDELIRQYGSGRVMFGSDEDINIPAELAKYKSLHISEQEREDCLWKTANHVFQLGL